VLVSGGAGAPTWSAQSSLTAGNVSGTVAIANGGTGQTTAAAAFGALKQDATTSATGVVSLATSAEAIAGTDASKALTAATHAASKIIIGTQQNTTSGTAINFSSVVPSWAKRVTVMFRGVSTSGVSNYQVRLGTSGGIVSSGYSSYFGYLVNDVNANTASGTAGFGIINDNAANALHGSMTLTLMDAASNVWVQSHAIGDIGGGAVKHGGGSVALAGVLTSIQITTVNGTDTFDAGTVNIAWE
jgi:hypothetical protein